MTTLTRAALGAICVLTVWTCQPLAQTPATSVQAKSAEKPPERPLETMPPLPPDAHVEQSIELNGKTVKYGGTGGAVAGYGRDGKGGGDGVFSSYIVDGRDRPVTFALNGGPGAASVYLNLGAIGPKRIQFGEEGDSPSDPATLKDNPGTWLDFTDLVFIDPIGTGFSRSLTTPEETKKQFFST